MLIKVINPYSYSMNSFINYERNWNLQVEHRQISHVNEGGNLILNFRLSESECIRPMESMDERNGESEQKG